MSLFYINSANAGFKSVFKSSSFGPNSSSGFKPISVQKSFQAVPPPAPTDFTPPLPNEPAPPLPHEPAPPPPPPPPVDQQAKKPFSFKMGSSEEQSQPEKFGGTAPAKQGLSFCLGKKKCTNAIQFGTKSKPAKSTAAAFAESSSEDEEEEEMPAEDTRASFENEDLTSTPTQQQDTLKKVIEYADTLKLKEALRPKLLIRFVKGTEQGGVLPGTIPTSADKGNSKKEINKIHRKFTERREIKIKNEEDKTKDSGNKGRDSEDSYQDRSKDDKHGKNSSDQEVGSERTQDRREDKYRYKQSKDYDDKKDYRKRDKNSRDRNRKNERYDFKESRDVDSKYERKSSSKKRDSKEGKRGFRENWED